jgi:hypothetical protein
MAWESANIPLFGLDVLRGTWDNLFHHDALCSTWNRVHSMGKGVTDDRTGKEAQTASWQGAQ